MKRFTNLCLMIFMIFCALFSCFNINAENKVCGALDSSDIVRQTQIIPTSKDELPNQSLKNDATFYQTPYDENKNDFMDGYSITPSVVTNSNSKYRRQIYEKSYYVNEFSVPSDCSIYMWVYLPDEINDNLFIFSLSFLSLSGEIVTWEYDDDTFDDLFQMSYSSNFGWILFEFKVQDAKKNTSSETTIFTQMILNYHFNYEKYSEKYGFEFNPDNIIINGSLSIYDVFVGKSKSSKTTIISKISYTIYKIKNEFRSKINAICLNDSLILDDLKNIFDYVFVGKYNLLLNGTQNNKFVWTFTIYNGSEKTTLNQNSLKTRVKFTYKGDCSVGLKLEETRTGRSVTLFNKTITFDCDEYSFGTFDKTKFKLNKGEKLNISFNTFSSFDIQSDINFVSSDEKVFKILESYYNETQKKYFVKIECLKGGSANLIAVATGTRNGEHLEEYSVSAKVDVNSSSDFLSSVYFKIILVFYGLATIVFVVSTIITKHKQKQLSK